jgi:hypothetical protein
MSNESSSVEKRVLPRLTLSHEVFRDGKTGKLFGVVDLSKSGMAIRINDPEDLYGYMVGAALEGILNLRREKLPVLGRVRHVGRDQVGIEFENLPEQTAQALNRVLDPHTLGADLRPIPTGDSSVLYASEGGTEFLLERDVDGRYTKLVVLVLGSLVQWDESGGLRTGKIESSYEESYVQGITRLEKMLFEEDRVIDAQKLGIAKTLISSSNVPEDLKKFCFRRLEGASA